MQNRDDLIREIYHDPETGFGSIREAYKRAKLRDPTIKEADVKTILDKLAERQRKRGGKFNSYIADKPLQQFHIDIAHFGDPKDVKVLPFAKYVFELITKIKETKTKRITTAQALAFWKTQDGFEQLFNTGKWTVRSILDKWDPFEIDVLTRGKAEIRLKNDNLPGLKGGKDNLINSKYLYAFAAVDVFSKKLFMEPMVTKSASEMQTAVVKCFGTLGQPESVYSDDDAGFTDIFLSKNWRDAVYNILLREAMRVSLREQ